VPDGIPDEQVLFLSDILPTGWQAALRGDIREGDTVAVWGCGPVGYFTHPERVRAGRGAGDRDRSDPERLALARDVCGAEVVNYEATEDLVELLKQMTGGRGPDVCIDAVGAGGARSGPPLARGQGEADAAVGDGPAHGVRQTIQAAAKGGRVSLIGVLWRNHRQVPDRRVFRKGLSMRAGQCDVQAFLPDLLEKVLGGEFDMTSIISHRLTLEERRTATRSSMIRRTVARRS
jgi:threonine dehydrogenase-like Zn-dependent dehydrogenase